MAINVSDIKEVFGVELVLERRNYPHGSGLDEYALVRGVSGNKFIVSITDLEQGHGCKSCGSGGELSHWRLLTLTYESLEDSGRVYKKLQRILDDVSCKRGGRKK